jgi:glycosyltransferase involved in cell wall biosynthesis
MRLGWFSPVPPVKSGIAGRSAELVSVLEARGHAVDVFADEPVARAAPHARSAHDFVWLHQRQPYDLVVYQFGNSSHHDYTWPYALRYPGLVVLHDAHLHHARAALLLRERRFTDYRREFAWDQPAESPDLAELAIAGLDSALYYRWPMVRMLISSARMTAVHGEGAARELRAQFVEEPDLASRIVSVQLGEGTRPSAERRAAARMSVRQAAGLSPDAVVFGVFGSLTPEKRLSEILEAFRATLPYAPGTRLLLAGAPAPNFDVVAAIRALNLDQDVVLTGYLPSDEALTDHLLACDVSLNLRWPTARETSGPWLRALAAGLPTVIADLAHLADVPSLDPRTWKRHASGDDAPGEAACIAVDILDEAHSLRLAMRRLATDPDLRQSLGSAAGDWWSSRHTVDRMAADYERVMAAARAAEPAHVTLPAHARACWDARLEALGRELGVDVSECIRAT